MKLSQIEINQYFTYNGKTYALDITGRDGSGKRAVFNVETKEKTMMPHNLEVELYVNKHLGNVFVSLPIDDETDIDNMIDLDKEE